MSKTTHKTTNNKEEGSKKPLKGRKFTFSRAEMQKISTPAPALAIQLI
ncbi:MAG: hypothetical protein HUK09_00955 [Bacteroidaceae bacterium]|nr:hypothetical protein [Bacteroidaceae bacterium]